MRRNTVLVLDAAPSNMQRIGSRWMTKGTTYRVIPRERTLCLAKLLLKAMRFRNFLHLTERRKACIRSPSRLY